ncbi:MAG: hypothetical protein Kilf2KO_04710 [Rhodospirillales bacterium]
MPSVGEVQKQVAYDMLATMQRVQGQLDKRSDTTRIETERRRQSLVDRQRAERRNLEEAQARRQAEESRARQARFRVGLKGLWDRLRGEHKRTREKNEREAEAARIRDQEQKEALVQDQLRQRQKLRQLIGLSRERQAKLSRDIAADMSHYAELLQSADHERTGKRRRTEHTRATRRRSKRRGADYEIDI